MASDFETQFVDSMSRLARLCVEYAQLSGHEMEQLWCYGYMEDGEVYFNAFAKVNGQLMYLEELGDRELLFRMLDLGIEDLCEIRKLFRAHQRPVPTQIKAICDIDAGTMKTQCSYDQICPEDGSVSSTDVFADWFESVAE